MSFRFIRVFIFRFFLKNYLCDNIPIDLYTDCLYLYRLTHYFAQLFCRRLYTDCLYLFRLTFIPIDFIVLCIHILNAMRFMFPIPSAVYNIKKATFKVALIFIFYFFRLARWTMSTEMSAGDTPDILLACPRFLGRISSSFCLASSLSPPILR